MAGSTGTPGPHLGAGAEFDLIRALTRDASSPPEVEVGSGDDAAVLEGGWVVTCDLSIEDIHFRRAWMSPEEIGGRAARVALSDLAAMAARPVAALVSMAGTRADHADGTLEAVGRGVRGAVEAVGATVIGGDVTRSPGPLTLDVTALGRSPSPVLRSGARVGDGLWVTGVLGGATTAVRLLEAGETLGPALREALVYPSSRMEEAAALARTGRLHALIDLSDGLAGDAGHLAAASGVRLVLEPARVPVHPGAIEALGEEDALAAALRGGEDYELLFAAAPDFDPATLAPSGIPLTRVGRVEAGEGVVLHTSDGSTVAAGRSWDHFGGPR